MTLYEELQLNNVHFTNTLLTFVCVELFITMIAIFALVAKLSKPH